MQVDHNLELLRLRGIWRENVKIQGHVEPISTWLWFVTVPGQDLWVIVGLTEGNDDWLFDGIDQTWWDRMSVFVGDPWEIIAVSPERMAEVQSKLMTSYDREKRVWIEKSSLDELRTAREHEEASAEDTLKPHLN